jgi:hypothetical protein
MQSNAARLASTSVNFTFTSNKSVRTKNEKGSLTGVNKPFFILIQRQGHPRRVSGFRQSGQQPASRAAVTASEVVLNPDSDLVDRCIADTRFFLCTANNVIREVNFFKHTPIIVDHIGQVINHEES